MNKNKLQNVLRLTGNDRLGYFTRKVADFEQVWGLHHEGWATAKTDDDQIVMPFWPESDFAEMCCQDEWGGYHPRKITLSDFLSKWLPGMVADGIKPVVFPTPSDKGVVLTPDELSKRLKEEHSAL